MFFLSLESPDTGVGTGRLEKNDYLTSDNLLEISHSLPCQFCIGGPYYQIKRDISLFVEISPSAGHLL